MNAPNDAPVVHHKAYLFHRCERPFIVILILALTSVQICKKLYFQGGETNISSVDDPYGLFSGIAYQNDLYDKLWQYCRPDVSVLCPTNLGVDDGPLALMWSFDNTEHGTEGAKCFFRRTPLVEFETYSGTSPDLTPLVEFETYSGTSPDLPSWLHPIADAVNSQPRSNTTFVDNIGSLSIVNYTWFVDDALLKEECLFDENTDEEVLFYDEEADSCNRTATMFRPTGESDFTVFQTNNTEGANLRGVLYQKEYASETGQRLTQQLQCCDNSAASMFGRTLDETFAFDFGKWAWPLKICTPSMCSPATVTSHNCSDMTLAAVWKYTFSSLAINVLHTLTMICLSALFSDQQVFDTAFAESPVNYPYEFNDLLRLLVEGSGNRTAQNLLHFFEQRERSTSKQFLDVLTDGHSLVTSLPNHCWDIDTFMGIIENATAQFRETAPENRKGAMNGTNTAWPSRDELNIMNLEKPFADALLHSIRIRRKNNWIEHTNETANVNSTNPSLSADSSVTPYWMDDCLLGHYPTELLDGSKCGKAINTTLHVSGKLPLSATGHYLAEERQGYVHFVGALVITLSLVQAVIRYQRLPGGRLFKIDKSRVKRRREQVRMALQDEYLCRERELRARQQLGEERAREVLRLLEVAAQRDPELPPDFQFKQRKISRYFAMSGHILLTLVGPLNDLDGYVNFECGLLFVNLLQSLLEIKAHQLVEQQQQSGTESPQVGGCIEHPPLQEAHDELVDGQNDLK